MQQKLWKLMDHFFEMLIVLTGEKPEDVSINHIL